MKRVNSVLAMVAVTLVLVLAPVAWGADVEGKIKSVDPSGSLLTLDDGTQIVIPPTFTVEKSALMPGLNVKVSYDEKDGQKVAKSFTLILVR
jgi:Protein of unknown function (DUF1344)